MKLRSWVVNLLLFVVTLSILMVVSTIETLGNPSYDRFLLINLVVTTIIIAILKKYAKFN